MYDNALGKSRVKGSFARDEREVQRTTMLTLGDLGDLGHCEAPRFSTRGPPDLRSRSPDPAFGIAVYLMVSVARLIETSHVAISHILSRVLERYTGAHISNGQARIRLS